MVFSQMYDLSLCWVEARRRHGPFVFIKELLKEAEEATGGLKGGGSGLFQEPHNDPELNERCPWSGLNMGSDGTEQIGWFGEKVNKKLVWCWDGLVNPCFWLTQSQHWEFRISEGKLDMRIPQENARPGVKCQLLGRLRKDDLKPKACLDSRVS